MESTSQTGCHEESEKDKLKRLPEVLEAYAKVIEKRNLIIGDSDCPHIIRRAAEVIGNIEYAFFNYDASDGSETSVEERVRMKNAWNRFVEMLTTEARPEKKVSEQIEFWGITIPTNGHNLCMIEGCKNDSCTAVRWRNQQVNVCGHHLKRKFDSGEWYH